MCRPGQLAVTVTAMYVGNSNWVGSGEHALLPLAPVSQIRYKGIKLNQYKSIQLKKTTKASDQVRQSLVPSLVTCTGCTVCLTPKEGVGWGSHLHSVPLVVDCWWLWPCQPLWRVVTVGHGVLMR